MKNVSSWIFIFPKFIVGTKYLAIFFLFVKFGYAQSNYFDISAYKNFLEINKDMVSPQLLQMYPAGLFSSKINNNWESALYRDSIDFHYKLTDNEKGLINKHGFVVTERLSYETFGKAFQEIYNKDLPVFISTDAILHALHFSYNNLLIDVERTLLVQMLGQLITKLHSNIQVLDLKYSNNESMKQMLRDVDLYLTVPRILIGQQVIPYYNENKSTLNRILNLISSEKPDTISLFASCPRLIDFSQFKVRGHYTIMDYPELAKYFKTMMWLGRIEIYLSAPRASFPPPLTPPSDQDIMRQTIDAILILEAVKNADAISLLSDIDNVIKFFVGESDNVTLDNIQELANSNKISSADQLLDTLKLKEFQDSLKTKSYAFQRILSQILYSNPLNPDSIIPASSFLLLGQRFIIDSYVTGQVVFDKIKFNGIKVKRMLPSTLDILFALGNNASAQLLQSELDKYHYSSNLSALRYLIDSYDSEYWNVSMYNLWLNAIRALNPPSERKNLPSFMQTAAWWQEKINTQLASWSELRHDNILYSKQSYTGGIVCSFPYSYVEPIPSFFEAIKNFAQIAKTKFQSITFLSPNGYNIWNDMYKSWVIGYFNGLYNISHVLSTIAQKELNSVKLDSSEISFLRGMLYKNPPECGPAYSGWFTNLYYGVIGNTQGYFKRDYVVADVHTAPTNERGDPVGWVLHGGTGKINMGILTAAVEGQSIAFIGPVMSYHEYVTTNFLRLTDEEWDSTYLSKSFRPSLTNLYLADNDGNSPGNAPSLLTGVNELPIKQPTQFTLLQNYPNPFNPTTIITYTIPTDLNNSKVELSIYDIQGKLIIKLIDNKLPPGNYMTQWNGKDNSGLSISSGVYLCTLKIGNLTTTKKLVLMK